MASELDEWWIHGALLAQVSGILSTLGAVLLRLALKSAVGYCQATGKRVFWAGVSLRLVACGLWCTSHCYTSDATVEAIFFVVSLLTNLAAGPPILHEMYHTKEVLGTLLCMAAAVVALMLDPDSRVSRDYIGCWKMEGQAKNALLGCTVTWSILSLICLVLFLRVRVRYGTRFVENEHDRHHVSRDQRVLRVCIPLLLGFVTGALHISRYMGFSWCFWQEVNDKDVQQRGHTSEDMLGVFLMFLPVLVLMETVLVIEGAKMFDCRFFVPTYSAANLFTSTMIRLIPRPFTTFGSVAPTLCATLVVFLSAFVFISPMTSTISLPRFLKKTEVVQKIPQTVGHDAFRHGTVEPLPLMFTPLLIVHNDLLSGEAPDAEDEVHMLRITEMRTQGSDMKRALSRLLFQLWTMIGRALPLTFLVAMPLLFAVVVAYCPEVCTQLLLVSVYTLWAVNSTALGVAVFSGVGHWKIKLCMETKYLELCETGWKRKPGNIKAGGGRYTSVPDPYDTSDSSESEDDGTDWRAVHHFVVVQGDLEMDNCQELHGFLSCLAESPIAASQISVLLRSQQTDGGQTESGDMSALDRVAREFSNSFYLITPLFETEAEDPTGELDTSYTAVAYIADFVRRSDVLSQQLTVVTYTTVDALFHVQYFCALTFAFLATTKKRGTTIWQPPILRLKDYYAQPGNVRQAALYLSSRQLMSSCNPVAVPLPWTTCSIPLTLLSAIDSSWEPEELKADLFECKGIWTKCWLATIGNSSVQPIFLPVIRRAEPGCSLLPLSQLRVYSQGLLELVYFWGAIPLALLGRRGTRKVYNGRLFCLLLRSMLPIAGIMSDHLATSTWLASIFLNLAALVYVRCTVTSWYHSWAVLLASTNMILAVCIVPMILIAHVSLFEQFKDRVLPLKSGDQKTDADFPSGGPAGTPTRASECSGPPDESTPWQFQNFWVHVFYLAFQGLVAGPVFLLTAFLAEFASAIDMMLPKAVSTQSCNACFGMEWS